MIANNSKKRASNAVVVALISLCCNAEKLLLSPHHPAAAPVVDGFLHHHQHRRHCQHSIRSVSSSSYLLSADAIVQATRLHLIGTTRGGGGVGGGVGGVPNTTTTNNKSSNAMRRSRGDRFHSSKNHNTSHDSRRSSNQQHKYPTSTKITASSSASSSTSSSSSSPSLAHVAGVSFSVVKAMLGTGMLALPMGVAAASNYKSALLPATVLLQLLAVLSAYTFALYGRLAHAMPTATSLQEMWRMTMTKPPPNRAATTNDDISSSSSSNSGGAIISMTNFMFCFGCCLAISLILGDTFSSLALGTTGRSANGGGTIGTFSFLPVWWRSRQSLILAVTTVFLLPLCQLKYLTALAPFSIVGVMGALTTVGFLGYRCPAVVTRSPYASGGVWGVVATAAAAATTTTNMATGAATATFGTYSRIFSLAPLSLVSMSCIALMAHFSAIDFYRALLPTTATTSDDNHDDNNSNKASSSSSSLVLRNFMAMTVGSFSVTAIISNLAMAFGFLTFGANAAGNILNNYHVNDRGAILSRLLCGISLIGSFPMVMRPCQGAALELLQLPPTDQNRVRMTTTLLAVVTALALTVKNVGFVISLNGAIMGTSLIYTIPCLLFLKLTKKESSSRSGIFSAIGGGSGVSWLKVERTICRLLIGFGLSAMVAGAATAVITSFYPQLLS